MIYADNQPYWPVAVMMLEKDISNQLSERNFIFEKISVMHQFDMLNIQNKFLVIIDGCSEPGCYDKSRQIMYTHSIPKDLNDYNQTVDDICDAIIAKYPNRVRYRKYKVYCQHCGAPIQPNEPNCSYCGQPYVEFDFKEEI